MQSRLRKSISVTPGFLIQMAAAVLLLPTNWVIAWVLAAAFHELCHLLALKLCGVQVFAMRITLFGAVIETESMQPKHEVITALAGPLGGCLLLTLLRVFPRIAISALLQSAFNLLPVYPFDGGRALRVLITYCRRKTPCKQAKVIVQ